MKQRRRAFITAGQPVTGNHLDHELTVPSGTAGDFMQPHSSIPRHVARKPSCWLRRDVCKAVCKCETLNVNG